MAISSVLSLTLPPLKPQSLSNPSVIHHSFSLRHSHKHLNCTLQLTSLQSISSSFFKPIDTISTIHQSSSPYFPKKLAVFAAKGYKMKTHKASAKRFRVTGKGKIVRRRAGKQHLLAKKSTRRKLRLSKMIQVNRSDYDNVVGALPYLKVNRNV